MKYTRFRDIPQLIQGGSYEVGVSPLHIESTLDNFRESGLDLNPDFQRGHVWTVSQQEKYLEWFFRGGRTGRVIYFNYPSWHVQTKTKYNDFVIVDGLQRLTALRKFFANEITLFGGYFREFTDDPNFTRHTVKFNVNDLQTRAEVLRFYIDFNTAGTVHSESEIERVKALLAQEVSK